MSYAITALIASVILTSVTAAKTGGNIESVLASGALYTFFCGVIAVVMYCERKKDKEQQ